MNFRTSVELPSKEAQIKVSDKILFLGSCFANNIGKRMQQFKFDNDVNPFGVIYNPISIVSVLEVLYRKAYLNEELPEHYLFEAHGVWRSWIHSTLFGACDKTLFRKQIEEQIAHTAERLKHLDVLFITLGTNHRYILKQENITVTNCHKQPSSWFVEEETSVSLIVESFEGVLRKIRAENPTLRIIFTISPYRYAKFGAHGNQLSKATLLLAVNALCTNPSFACSYFPAYEIVNDELRDYRFYAEDMLHPSQQAIDYIWERFSECYFDATTKEFLHEWETIQKAIAHEPFCPKSVTYRAFLVKIMLKIDALREKYPNLAVQNELEELKHKIELQ
ncbi:MAG: GSCFA domain-containing protein [Bacteroidaceae bacterium]